MFSTQYLLKKLLIFSIYLLSPLSHPQHPHPHPHPQTQKKKLHKYISFQTDIACSTLSIVSRFIWDMKWINVFIQLYSWLLNGGRSILDSFLYNMNYGLIDGTDFLCDQTKPPLSLRWVTVSSNYLCIDWRVSCIECWMISLLLVKQTPGPMRIYTNFSNRFVGDSN